MLKKLFKGLNKYATQNGNIVFGDMAGGDITFNQFKMDNITSGGTINVNGKTFNLPANARNVSVRNGAIYIDGKKFDGTKKDVDVVSIQIGTVGELSGTIGGNVVIDSVGTAKEISTASGDVTINKVTGSPCAISISTASGDVSVTGNAHNIKTVSGDVDITGDALGPVNTVSGDISRRK